MADEKNRWMTELRAMGFNEQALHLLEGEKVVADSVQEELELLRLAIVALVRTFWRIDDLNETRYKRLQNSLDGVQTDLRGKSSQASVESIRTELKDKASQASMDNLRVEMSNKASQASVDSVDQNIREILNYLKSPAGGFQPR